MRERCVSGWFSTHGIKRHAIELCKTPTRKNGSSVITGQRPSRSIGEGDFLLAGRRILAGTGFRSDPRSHAEAQEFFGLPVLSPTLVNPKPLPPGHRPGRPVAGRDHVLP